MKVLFLLGLTFIPIPQEFDPQVQGALRPFQVIPIGLDHIQSACGIKPPKVVYAYTIPEAGIIFILDALVGDDFAQTLRHEIAHINGWRHAHE